MFSTNLHLAVISDNSSERFSLWFKYYELLMVFWLQVPYYLGELTEKVAQDDRIQILKASQAKLKVKHIQ